MGENVIGLDIGGANLKAATAAGAARARSFQLWKHPDQLGNALRDFLTGWEPRRLAVTMTGELCDCFETKRDGVDRIIAQVEQAFSEIPIGIWSTEGELVSPEDARQNPLRVAAANWHALATFAGGYFHSTPHAPREGILLLVDVGSTTSDIIPIVNGRPSTRGLTDPERLRSKELVYTGFRRTPVCALFQGEVMAEFFATTHDVYLLLGMIADDADDRSTADGRPATATNAHARLARMLGGDAEVISCDQTRVLAESAFAQQRRLLVEALRVVTGRLPAPPQAVVVSGSGELLARAAWRDFAADTVPVVSLAEILGKEISTAACAYAVAVLAEKLWQT